jgi:hypothetical protein
MLFKGKCMCSHILLFKKDTSEITLSLCTSSCIHISAFLQTHYQFYSTRFLLKCTVTSTRASPWPVSLAFLLIHGSCPWSHHAQSSIATLYSTPHAHLTICEISCKRNPWTWTVKLGQDRFFWIENWKTWIENNKWFPGMETALQFSFLQSGWIKKRVLKLVKVNHNTNPKNPKNIKKIQIKRQENNKEQIKKPQILL